MTDDHSLFRIIRRISENADIKASLDLIRACLNEAILDCPLKLLVSQNNRPLSMQDLLVQPRHKLVWNVPAPCLGGHVILEAACELETIMSGVLTDASPVTHLVKICNVVVQIQGWSASAVLRFVGKCHIAWPQFLCTEGRNVSFIGPKHQSDDYSRPSAPWLGRRVLKFLVGFHEGVRVV